jgi:cardiolipin synthase
MSDPNKPKAFAVWTLRGTTYVRMPIVALIGLLLALTISTILIWSVKREPHTVLRSDDVGELRALIPSMIGLTQSSLDEGNRVEILQNGAIFPRVFQDVAAARESVHVETFIWHDGALTKQFVALLVRKAREGVHVRILVDASGGRELDGEEQEMLERAGANVAHFHPIRLSNLGRINNRDHRKLVIVDGRIAYTGGVGWADEWTGNAENKQRYRETNLRITGPAVNRLQGAFAENWIEETGEIAAADEYFPRLTPAGPTSMHVVYTSPTGSISSVQILYHLAISGARKEILIQNPYLLPSRQAIGALAAAVKRGVRVRIMVPSVEVTDSPIVQHASHVDYGPLLEAGIEIWEYQRTLLHQKVIAIDGVWSSIGSTNFDDRSFQLNDELNVGILDPDVAAELRRAFEEDLKHAKRATLDEWRGRSLWHRTIDRMAYLGRSQL